MESASRLYYYTDLDLLWSRFYCEDMWGWGDKAMRIREGDEDLRKYSRLHKRGVGGSTFNLCINKSILYTYAKGVMLCSIEVFHVSNV